MAHRIDEVDKRILYRLAQDARNTTTSDIAEEMDVTSATIRNRIEQLEEQDILRGILLISITNPLTNMSRTSLGAQLLFRIANDSLSPLWKFPEQSQPES